MKLRLYLQVAVYSTVVFSAQLASATDLGYTNTDQRFRDLELRIDSLEAARSAVNLAAFNGCDTNCGDGCDSCGSGVSCKSSCGGSCCWLRPCPTAQIDAELLLFTVGHSEASTDSQDDLNAGFRLTYGRVNEQGQIFRVRYFHFHVDTEADRLEMDMIDTEIGRRFTLGGGLKGEVTAGLRIAPFHEDGDMDYDASFGPLVGVQLRGRKLLRGTSYANLRHSWQYGDARDGGNPRRPGTFNISELQFGLEWKRPVNMGTLVLRTAIEAQYWGGVADAQTEDYGLIGSATSVGLAY